MSNLVTYYNFSKDNINGTYNSNRQYAAYLINTVIKKVDATILSNISDLGFDRDGPNGLKCIWIHENNQAYVQLNPRGSTNNGISFATWIYCECGGRTWARVFDFGNGAGEDNKDTIFGIQNYGQCWTGNNESIAYKYGPVYDRNKFNPLGTSWTNMVYVRTEAFPEGEPVIPTLMPFNFNDSLNNIKSSEENVSSEIIESFNNNNDLFYCDITKSCEKICGFILLILFIITILIIYKFNKK